MATGVAIGYDWLHDELSMPTRASLREALVQKALRPGLDPSTPTNWWYTNESNWNQVCIGGLVLGALCCAGGGAVELTKQILALARTYSPNGLEALCARTASYPEGPGYWNYGTSYQVLLLAALESALGNRLGPQRKSRFPRHR